MAERMKTLDEKEAISTWSDSWRKTLRMVLIAACVGGIEFSYAAETALVSPLLLQLGVPVYLMTMTWCVSPLLGMVIVPILGSASDTCTSSMGRRRPFIIIYSVGVVFGLLLVPYGRNIGELLGDSTFSKLAVMAISDNNHTTISLMDNQTSFVNQTISAARDEHVPNHRIGIIFTIIGLMILDFCCDGCQIPSRTLMVDLTTDKDRTRGLSMFSVVAGAGGMVGYTLAGIGYHSQTSSGILDPLFFKHVHVVFGVVLGLYLLGSMLTVFGVSETPLNKKDSIHKYKRMYSEDGKDQISEHKLSESESSSSQNSYDRLKMTEMKEELGSTVTHIEETSELVSPPPEGSDEEKQLDQEETAEDMRVFLKTIINMPRYMWILCLTNLFSWMALVTFSLYYTDYVGQSVYGGSPLSPVGSEKRNIYDKGVRMGSLGMVAYSFSSCLFSFFLDKLINRFRTKIVYVGGLMTNCIGMAVMAATNNYIVAFIAPLTTGVLYTTTFTMPYILVSRYHSDKTLTPLKLEKGKIQKRGLGTDIAIVSSVVFVGQFTISAVIGVIIHAAGSTIMVPIVASILALCAAISASFVEYLDY